MPLIRLLVSRNPLSVNVPAKKGQTPLLLAALQDHADVVQYLHSKGGDINQAERNGKTPMYVAAMYNAPNSIRILHTLGNIMHFVAEKDIEMWK